MKLLSHILTLFLVIGFFNTSHAQFPKLTHFAMIWNFCDQNGNLLPSRHNVCVGDRVYLINQSRYGATPNGGNGQWPINNRLVSGYYRVSQIATTIPAASWKYGEIISFVATSNITSLPSNGLGPINFTVSYHSGFSSSGATAAPGGSWWSRRGLYLYRIPSPNFYLFDRSICPGEPANLYASGTTSGSTFQWSTGQTTSSITVSPSVTTTYSLTVTGSNGCSATKDVMVTVLNDQLSVNSQYYYCGRSGPNICPAEGNSSTSWYFNGNGQSTLMHTGPCFTPAQPGSYTVMKSSPCFAIKNFEVIDLGGQLNPNFNLSTSDKGTYYSITVNATQGAYPTNVPNIGHFWLVEDMTTGCVFNNPSQWWGGAYPSTANSFTNNFPEYGATNCQASTTYSNHGRFEYGHTYKIIRGLWSDCDGWTGFSATINMDFPPVESNSWGKTLVYSDLASIDALPEGLTPHNFGNNTENTTSLSEITAPKQVQFDLFPNPTNGHFSLKFVTDIEASIQVVDLMGKILLQETIQGSTSDLDISNQPSGVYFIKIISDDLITTKRIIKN